MKLVPKPCIPANLDAIVTVGGARAPQPRRETTLRRALERQATTTLACTMTRDERKSAGIALHLERVIAKSGGSRATWAYDPARKARA